MRKDLFERICRIAAIILMISYIVIDLRYEIASFIVIYPYADLTFWEYLDYYKFEILQYAVMIAAIVILIKRKRGGLPVVMCICALMIAVDCSIEAYLMLIDYRTVVIDVVFFIEGVLSLIVAAMLFFNTIIFMRGLSKSAALIKYAALILLALQLLSIIIRIRSKDSAGTILEALFMSSAYILLEILLLAMTSSKEINQRSIMGNIGSSIRDMRAMMMEEGIGIDRSTAARFSDYNRNGLWCDSYSFVLTSFRGAKYAMALTPSGDKNIVSISSTQNHSAMNSFRFDLTGVWFDTGDAETCDLMRFYGNDGVFIQLIVRNAPPVKPKKAPKIGLIMLISREVETNTYRFKVKVSEFASRIADFFKGLRSKKKDKGEE